MNGLEKAYLSNLDQVVIFRALQLGDMLNAVPAFRALRAAHPNANIALVGLPWCDEFVERYHAYFDEFISFPGFPGLPEQDPDLPALLSMLTEIQARRFDLAIQMQGSGDIVNPMIGLFGAKQTAGYFLPGQYCPDPNFFMKYPDDIPESWRHLRLMEFLGIPPQGSNLELPLFERDWHALQHIQQEYGLGKDYVCIHPGARGVHRCWSSNKFAVVADWLVSRGYQIVLTGTTGEAELTASVARHMQARSIDLAGKTDLGTLGALVARSRLVISNDTGVAHVAAALKIPSVILFAVSDSIRWAPVDERLHKRIWQAMDKTPDQVIPQIEKHLLETSPQSQVKTQGTELIPLEGGML